MAIRIMSQDESYRLISDECGRYAVIEARNGHVYSLDDGGHRPRHEASDCAEGMALVVGDGGWTDENRARNCFDLMVRRERRYSETIW